MTGTGDFLTNLAAALAYDLLCVGAARLQRMAFGSPEQQALRRWLQAVTASGAKPGAVEARVHLAGKTVPCPACCEEGKRR